MKFLRTFSKIFHDVLLSFNDYGSHKFSACMGITHPLGLSPYIYGIITCKFGEINAEIIEFTSIEFSETRRLNVTKVSKMMMNMKAEM